MKAPGTDFSRRKFLTGSAAALAAPLILPSRLFGQNAPSNTLNVAIAGCGNRFRGHWGAFAAVPGVRVMAVCDIWEERARAAKATVDQTNGDTTSRAYHDYREMIADPEVDIVSIAVPDHWHALVAIEAANAGKHIYLEKPFGYSVEEGRAIINAVNRSGVMLQYGTQQRSNSFYQRTVHLARSGALGHVHTTYAVSPVGPKGGDGSKTTIPEGYDYEFFTGPAPRTPFYEDLAFRKPRGTPGWYFTSVFGGGWVTAWGTHHVDCAQWALGKDHEAPVTMEATGSYPETGMFDTSHSWTAEFKYADGRKLVYCTTDRPECPRVDGLPGFHGLIAVGDRGWAACTRGAMRVHPEQLGETNWPKDDPELQLMDRGSHNDHFTNFIDGIRYGTRLNTDREAGQLSANLCHLTNIGIETQRPLKWDAQTETIVNDPVANRLLGRPMRAPWKLA